MEEERWEQQIQEYSEKRSEVYLPNEIFHHIFTYLSLHDLILVNGVSRRIREISTHQTLWKPFYLEPRFEFYKKKFLKEILKKKFTPIEGYVEPDQVTSETVEESLHVPFLKVHKSEPIENCERHTREIVMFSFKEKYESRQRTEKMISYLTNSFHWKSLYLYVIYSIFVILGLLVSTVVSAVAMTFFRWWVLYLISVCASAFSLVTLLVMIATFLYHYCVSRRKHRILEDNYQQLKERSLGSDNPDQYVVHLVLMILFGLINIPIFLICLNMRGVIGSQYFNFSMSLIPFYVSCVLYLFYNSVYWCLCIALRCCPDNLEECLDVSEMEDFEGYIFVTSSLGSSNLLPLFVFVVQLGLIAVLLDGFFPKSSIFYVMIPSYLYLILICVVTPIVIVIFYFYLNTNNNCGSFEVIVDYLMLLHIGIVIQCLVFCPFVVFVLLFSFFFFFNVPLFYCFAIPFTIQACFGGFCVVMIVYYVFVRMFRAMLKPKESKKSHC